MGIRTAVTRTRTERRTSAPNLGLWRPRAINIFKYYYTWASVCSCFGPDLTGLVHAWPAVQGDTCGAEHAGYFIFPLLIHTTNLKLVFLCHSNFKFVDSFFLVFCKIMIFHLILFVFVLIAILWIIFIWHHFSHQRRE